VIAGILRALLDFIRAWYEDYSRTPTRAVDAPPTDPERQRLRERVREWESRGAGGSEPDNHQDRP